MELLATNQPWNLLIFMAIPIVLAETLAITELYLLSTRNYSGWVNGLNRVAGITVGLYFIGVIVYPERTQGMSLFMWDTSTITISNATSVRRCMTCMLVRAI